MKLTTPFSHITDIRSSTPFTPLGILVKSSFPRAFWQVLKVQWSVPVVVKSPLEKKNTRECVMSRKKNVRRKQPELSCSSDALLNWKSENCNGEWVAFSIAYLSHTHLYFRKHFWKIILLLKVWCRTMLRSEKLVLDSIICWFYDYEFVQCSVLSRNWWWYVLDDNYFRITGNNVSENSLWVEHYTKMNLSDPHEQRQPLAKWQRCEEKICDIGWGCSCHQRQLCFELWIISEM